MITGIYLAYAAGYLLFCASGCLAVVKLFTMPRWNSFLKKYDDGLNVSWCELLVIMVLALIPIANVSMNCFWLWVLRRQIWPHFKLPKCPIAIHGGKANDTQN